MLRPAKRRSRVVPRGKAPRGRARRAQPPAASPEAAAQILDLLEAAHPEAACALHYRNPFELVVATILSAQCTDKRVNEVTPALFARYPHAAALAAASHAEIEEIIRPTGFFRAKAKSLIGCARALVAQHGGAVPPRMEELVRLPGVGRKTANVVLGHAFDVAEGIAVDTHVLRVANRLGLVRSQDPLEVEAALMALVPRERWTRTTDLLIFHGRKVCDARRPDCGYCTLFAHCAFESRQAWALAASGHGSSAGAPRASPPRRRSPRR
jgi:endonuclease III